MAVRIPITIKIPVNDAGRPSGMGLVRIATSDLSSGLEKISVRVLNRRVSSQDSNKLQRIKPVTKYQIRRSSPSRYPVLFEPKSSAATPMPQPVVVLPNVHYTVKTIHITLSLPKLPSPTKLWNSITGASRKTRLRLGVVMAVIALLAAVQLFDTHKSTTATPNNQPPVLERSSPKYNTILPAGKTIEQLGGWARISPPDKDPVYTYVDKVGTVQINVSEQPLPTAFQGDTATKIAQFAKDNNATNKFTADNNTAVYVATYEEGPQSVIFSKDGLLVLIKSTGPLSNNQWAAYISSLQ